MQMTSAQLVIALILVSSISQAQEALPSRPPKKGDHCDINVSVSVNFGKAFSVDKAQRELTARVLTNMSKDPDHPDESFEVAPDLKPTLESRGMNQWKLQIYTAARNFRDELVPDALIVESPQWTDATKIGDIKIRTGLLLVAEEDGCPRVVVAAKEKDIVFDNKTVLMTLPTSENSHIGSEVNLTPEVHSGLGAKDGISGFILVRKSHYCVNQYSCQPLDPRKVLGF
jgi:hypothetical protein